MIKTPLLLASLLLMGAAPASAATLTTAYFGTITDGSDDLGFFGGPSTNFSGMSYEAVYTFDLNGPANTGLSDGTSYFQANAPVVTASIKLNGKIYTVPNINDAQQAVSKSPGFQQIEDHAYGSVSNGSASYSSRLREDIVTNPNTTGHSITQSASYSAPINFDVSRGDVTQGDFTIFNGKGGDTSFDLSAVHVSTHVSGAPEPGTWAMMLLGLGLAGWTMRRRLTIVRTPALAAA